MQCMVRHRGVCIPPLTSIWFALLRTLTVFFPFVVPFVSLPPSLPPPCLWITGREPELDDSVR